MSDEHIESEFEADSDIDIEREERPQLRPGQRPGQNLDRRHRKPAREKIMDLIAKRDHSELELKRKLSVHYEAEEVADAIQFARENKWLKPPEELAEIVSRQLNRKNKGARYVQRFLHSRGLPSMPKDSAAEREKALELVKIKLALEPPFAFDDQKKIARLLTNRGFDDETIRKIIHEKP